MPTVYGVPLVLPAESDVVLQVAVPTFTSLEFSRTTNAVQSGESPLSRFTKVTDAFRMSPGFGSATESTAVISRMVAASVTVAVVLGVDEVQKSIFPP